MPHDRCRSYTARYVFSGESPPVENGVIEITDGVVTAVHDRNDPDAVDFGNAAIIPGLVNAHTHLEFSDLAEPIGPTAPFTDWIRGVVAHRRQRTKAVSDIMQAGLTESVQSGTALLGDIATDDDRSSRVCRSGSRVILFREVLGFASEQIAAQRETAERFLAQFPQDGDIEHTVQPGLSPHAPYSVHPDLFRDIVRMAAAARVPVAMHLAETRDELELLDRGTGPFVEMLQRFGVWRDGVISRGTQPLDYLRQLATAERALVIHGNYLTDEELQFVAAHENMTLVFCPRSHAYFGHGAHPWRQLIDLGGRVAIGTDSRASNPDLSLWRELCFLKQQHPDAADRQLLQLGTQSGAAALGLEHTTGILAPGRSADLAVIALRDPFELFAAENECLGTMVAGRWRAEPPFDRTISSPA